MKCPRCGHEWEPRSKSLARELGAKGGSKSRRGITPEQQAKMQEARRRKLEGSQQNPTGQERKASSDPNCSK